MELDRRVSAVVLSQAKIKALRMPERVKDVFILLGGEKNIGVKGGYPKMLLQVLMKQWGDIRGNRNWRAQGYDWPPFDLDIALALKNLSEKTLIETQGQRVNSLVEKLRRTVELKGESIEAIQGNFNDEEFIKGYLERQDMTINEIIAVPNNNSWTLHFTDKCKRDTINGAGILSPNGEGTVRWHKGAMMASQKGTTRLLQALVESKVKSIYLPQRWIDINKKESQRLLGKDLKYRGVFGGYGHIMCRRYVRNETLQVKLMEILKALQLTDFNIDEFAGFYNEQNNIARLYNGGFHYNSNMSFLENQTRIKIDKLRKKETKQERTNRMYECEHKQIETSICDGCQWKCTVWKCPSCNLTAIKPAHSRFFIGDLRELLCNRNFIGGDWYWDKEGFRYI